MWIKTAENELINTDRLVGIYYDEESGKTEGAYAARAFVTIAHKDVTQQITEALYKGRNYMEVR